MINILISTLKHINIFIYVQEVASPTGIVPKVAMKLAQDIAPFRIVNGYGLFRRMTGVSSLNGRYMDKNTSFVPSIVARPEIIIEGMDSLSGVWEEIHFNYKPGNLYVAPKWVAPYQPRLDWQMWFAGEFKGFFLILVASCFMWSGELDSSD